MSVDIRATAVPFDDAMRWVDLEDGRNLDAPVAWYPRLDTGPGKEERES